MLALTGPYRALGDLCQVYVEFDLKIKDEGAVDEDFSKGLLKLNAIHGSGIPFTSSPRSYLSTVEMVCVPVYQALEASIGVNFFNGKSTFTGKIFASTSEIDTSKMVKYDSQVPGTKTKFWQGSKTSFFLASVFWVLKPWRCSYSSKEPKLSITNAVREAFILPNFWREKKKLDSCFFY